MVHGARQTGSADGGTRGSGTSSRVKVRGRCAVPPALRQQTLVSPSCHTAVAGWPQRCSRLWLMLRQLLGPSCPGTRAPGASPPAACSLVAVDGGGPGGAAPTPSHALAAQKWLRTPPPPHVRSPGRSRSPPSGMCQREGGSACLSVGMLSAAAIPSRHWKLTYGNGSGPWPRGAYSPAWDTNDEGGGYDRGRARLRVSHATPREERLPSTGWPLWTFREELSYQDISKIFPRMGWRAVGSVLGNPARVTSLSGLFKAFAEIASGLACYLP